MDKATNNYHLGQSANFKVEVRNAQSRLDTNEDKAYAMGSRPKGLALIINEIYQEDGSNREGLYLTQLWANLGYKVVYHTNLTLQELKKAILEFRESVEHAGRDSCVFFFCGEGEEGADGQLTLCPPGGGRLPSSWVLKQFNNVNLSRLKGKPKLLFFKITRCSEDEIQERKAVEPTLSSDMMLVTTFLPFGDRERLPAFREKFIRDFCQVMMDKAATHSLAALLKLVEGKMSKVFVKGKFPLSLGVSSTLTKEVFFNPGLYELDAEGDSEEVRPSYRTVLRDMDEIYALRAKETEIHQPEESCLTPFEEPLPEFGVPQPELGPESQGPGYDDSVLDYEKDVTDYEKDVTDYEEAVPESEEAVPESEEAVPEYDDSVPEYDDSVPEHEVDEPESEGAGPEHEVDEPESEGAGTEYAETVPESEGAGSEYEEAMSDTLLEESSR